MASLVNPTSRHFRLQEIHEGVFAAIATADGWAVGNAGIVDLGDRVVVFDTLANHLAAEDLRAAAEAVTGKSVDYVLLSHAHRDHVKGNQVFGTATIVATRKTTEAMTQNWKQRTERVRREGLDPIRRGLEEEFAAWMSNPATTGADQVLWEGYKQALLQGLEAYDLKLPSVSFETALRFHGSKATAEGITFGGGHSGSDALLYLPDARVAYLGDLLFIGTQPYLGDGDPEEYLRILDRIEALDAKALVPGHGPVGTSRDLQTMRDYVAAVEKAAGETRGSPGDAKGVAQRPIPPPFDSMNWRAFWGANVEFFAERGPRSAHP